MFSTSHFHPMLVHFPIALITMGFIFDLANILFKKEPCLSRAGFWLSVLGMLGAIAAWLSGYIFTDPMEGEAGLMRDRHELFATATLITITIAGIYRILLTYWKKQSPVWNYMALGVMAIAFILVSITGFLGGTLVLEYMIGI